MGTRKCDSTKQYKPEMPKHRLDSFCFAIRQAYNSGLSFELAFKVVVDPFIMSENATSRIRNASIKILKQNNEWDVNRK